MKILQSSVFRAICAIAIGILLIKFPDNTVTWITVAIGILFLLSGIISLVVYIHARKNVSEYKITDAEGRVVAGEKPTFPIVGVGSIILGFLLALTPNIVIIKPLAPASMAMLVLGWCSLLYGVTEMINSLKFYSDKRKARQAQEIPVAEEVIEEVTATEEVAEETTSTKELPVIEDETSTPQ